MINSDLQKLIAVLPPPEKPFAASGDWIDVQTQLGIELPSEYKQFIATYGSGKICNFFVLFSPFVKNEAWNLTSYISLRVAGYSDYISTNVLDKIPFPLYPQKEGLIPFGTTENGHIFNWHSKGDPDHWPIIIWDMDYLDFIETNYASIIKYIHDLLTQRIGLTPREVPFDWLNPPHEFVAIDFDTSEWQWPPIKKPDP